MKTSDLTSSARRNVRRAWQRGATVVIARKWGRGYAVRELRQLGVPLLELLADGWEVVENTREQYIDLEYKEQMQRELNARVAQRLVDEADSGPYRIAVLSAVNGKWDDVMKDVRRGRITKEQAKEIVDRMQSLRLLTPFLGATFRERIEQLLETHGQEE